MFGWNFCWPLNVKSAISDFCVVIAFVTDFEKKVAIFEIEIECTDCNADIWNWQLKLKNENWIKMKNEIGNWGLKCSWSRVHLCSLVSLLFEKGCALNFVSLPGIVHVFEEHECGHCFSENIHYGTFLEFFWRGIINAGGLLGQ